LGGRAAGLADRFAIRHKDQSTVDRAGWFQVDAAELALRCDELEGNALPFAATSSA